MDNTMMMDVDPLSSFDAQYSYQPLPNTEFYIHPTQSDQHPQHTDQHPSQTNQHPPQTDHFHPAPLPLQPDSYTFQNDQAQNYPPVPFQPMLPNIPKDNTYLPNLAQEMDTETNDQHPAEPEEEEDIKPDISTLLPPPETKKLPRSKKPRGKISSYWNKKITDKDFKFYGCSICNIAFKELEKLDQHVVVHSNRLTTYELRILNLKKRKLLKKQIKKKKKEAKIKKESEIEIKPEDGYIGTEKAADFSDEKKDVKNEVECKGDVKSEKEVLELKRMSPAHAKIENEKKYVHAYKCFGCNKLFALSYYLKLHVRSHTGEKPYLCKECGQYFITASKLNRHKKRIHLATRHQCRICYRIFTRFELLVKHFDSRHAEDKLDGEPYDYNAILPYIKELEEQLKIEKEEKPNTEEPWAPEVADGVAAPSMTADDIAKDEIFVAKKEQEIPPPETIVCFEENKDSEPLPTIKVVIEELKVAEYIKQEVEDDNEAGGFQEDDMEYFDKDLDPGSDEEYKPSKTWVRPHSPLPRAKKHKPSAHCPVCNKFISRKANLPLHMRSHTGEKPFPCDECGRSYSSANTLKRHKLDVHNHAKEKKPEVKGKREPETEPPKNETESLQEPEDNDVEDATSDEDYFPSETWARSPSPLQEPTSPPSRQGKSSSTCEICKKKLCSKTYLAIHMRTHTGEKPFSCYLCKRRFITASKMHRHVLTHDEYWEGKEEIKQEDGSTVKPEADTEDNEGIDKDVIDKAKSKLLLKKTKKSFFESKKEKKHGKWTHTCEFCNKRFLHLETLLVHKKTHDKNESMKCYYCLEEFTDMDILKEHQSTHTGAKLFQCNQCRRMFAKRGTMVHHRKKCEAAEPSGTGCSGKRFLCEICNKSYNAHSKLQRHLASHSVSQFSVRYECPVCAHMFHTRYHVQMHLRSHMKEGLILEENRSAVLAMVLQNAHKIPKTTEVNPATLPETPADERSRICNICGQIFQHFYYLEEHLKTHGSKIALEHIDEEEEKKHTCQVCFKSFKLPYYLKLHSFTHTKEKPFICQQCGKGFITKGKLKRHLETHQGLKKYQCHICCKFFTRPSYLRIHVRTIHGTQDYHFRDYGLGVPIGVLSQD